MGCQWLETLCPFRKTRLFVSQRFVAWQPRGWMEFCWRILRPFFWRSQAVGQWSCGSDVGNIGSNIGAGLELATQDNITMGVKTGDDRYFKGRIAQMRIYNRALTQEQIQAIQKLVVAGNETKKKKVKLNVLCNVKNIHVEVHKLPVIVLSMGIEYWHYRRSCFIFNDIST